MPYTQYTNDSDVQFSKQLDSFKLGIGSKYGHSDYAATEAALDMLPMEMNVAKLLQTRATLHGASMDTRAKVAGDRDAKKEMDEYDSYLMEAKDAYDPDNPVQTARNRQGLQNRYEGNRFAQASLAASHSAGSWGVESKAKRNAGANLDFEYANREVDEKIRIEQAGLSLKQIQYQNERFKEIKSLEGTQKVSAAGKAFGNVYDQDPKMYEAGIHFIQGLATSGKFEEIDEVTEMMSSFSSAYSIEEGYSEEIKSNTRLQKMLQSDTGVDVINASPEEKAARYAEAETKIRDKYGKDPAALSGNLARLRAISEFDNKITELQGGRSGLKEQMMKWMKSKPADLNTPEGQEWLSQKAVLTMKAGVYGGIVEKRFAERQREYNTNAQNQKLFEKHLDIIKKQQDIKFGPQNQAFKQAVIDMRRDGLDKDRMAMVLRAAGAIDGTKIRTVEELKQRIEEVAPMVEDGFGLEDSVGEIDGI